MPYLLSISIKGLKDQTITITLTSSAVIPSVIRGGCYVLKTVTPTETRSAATAVSLPSVLRGAGVPVINSCPEQSADHVCCAVNWSHSVVSCSW